MFMIRPFEAADTDAVIAIWRACELTRPWNNPRADIARKLAVQPELFFIGCHAQTPIETPIATAMFGYDGHRGWLYYFAVLPEYQNKGVNAVIMSEFYKTYKKNNIKITNQTPELEDNTQIHSMWKNFDVKVNKRRSTYVLPIN